MNTNLGKIALTENQILNWKPSGIWEMFSYINGEVIAVSKIEPTQEQIISLKSELQALPDMEPKERVQAREFQEREVLIESKKRELAIQALKAEGKLDQNGKIKK